MAIATHGTMGVDWEQRIDFDRLRTERLAKAKAVLAGADAGALLVFDMNNVRYLTATHIGTWAQDKVARFALLPDGDEPILWDFGSAAKHHQLYAPWLDGPKRSRPGVSMLRGTLSPEMGRAEKVAGWIHDELEQRGLLNDPVAIDIVEPPVLFALQNLGITVVDGQQLMLEARKIKTVDEISLLTHAAGMVDASYQLIYEQLKPGVRENDMVGLVSDFLYRNGSEMVEGVNAISGERCNPHPHVASDRMLRPGDPAYFDILHSYMGYRTCYYRTFVVGSASQAQERVRQVPRHPRRGDLHDPPGRHHRRGRLDLAQGAGVRLRRRGGRLRAAVRPRPGPQHLGEADLQPAVLAGSPRGDRGGDGVRPRDVLARRGRLVRRPD